MPDARRCPTHRDALYHPAGTNVWLCLNGCGYREEGPAPEPTYDDPTAAFDLGYGWDD